MLSGFYKVTDTDRQKILRDKAENIIKMVAAKPQVLQSVLDFVDNIQPHVRNYFNKAKIEEKERAAAMIYDADAERNRISERISGFDPKNNIAWRTLTDRLGSNLTQRELLSIARLVSQEANIKLDRDARRRKIVLIKWFVENWKFVEPRLSDIVLETDLNDTHDGFDIMEEELQLIQ